VNWQNSDIGVDLPDCNAVLSAPINRQGLLTFRSNLFSLSLNLKMETDSMFLRNVGIYLNVHTSLQPRRAINIFTAVRTSNLKNSDMRNKTQIEEEVKTAHCLWYVLRPGAESLPETWLFTCRFFITTCYRSIKSPSFTWSPQSRPWFDTNNNNNTNNNNKPIWWRRLQMRKLLTMQSSPAFFHFIPLTPKYTPQHTRSHRLQFSSLNLKIQVSHLHKTTGKMLIQ
jgi:hypothetical protein